MAFNRDALRRELTSEPESFLLKIRMYEWDRDAFTRLEQLMRAACAELENETVLERWMVEGFWLLSDELADVTRHPDFPRPEPAEYYEAAIQRMWDLQYWFVVGQSLYAADHVWEPL